MGREGFPVRIAQVVGKMMMGGVESVVMNYYRHMDRDLVQFDFIVDDDSRFVPADEIERLGGRIYRIPPYQKPFARHSCLVKLLRRNQYQIVHSHINCLSFLSLFAAWRARIPVRIAHSHSAAGAGDFARNMLKGLLRPFSRLCATDYVACSEDTGRWLFGNSLFDSGKVTLLNNAIDVDAFRFSQRLREETRKQLGVDGSFVVGHVGRFVRQKNHSFLLDIFMELHRKRPDAVLLLVGEGELLPEVRAKVFRLGLGHCVRFLGVRRDINALLSAMDLFLLPSLYEGFPVVAVEAQANGLTVLAADTVTKDAKLTYNFEFLPLNRSALEWGDKILSLPCSVRQDNVDSIRLSGLDITKESNNLAALYSDMIRLIPYNANRTFAQRYHKLFFELKQFRFVRYLCRPFINASRARSQKEYAATEYSKYISSIRNIHEGERCFIIGNGASLTASNLEMLADEYTFGSNYIFEIFDLTFWRPTYYVAVDKAFIRMNGNKINALDIEDKFIIYDERNAVAWEDENTHFIFVRDPFEVQYGSKEALPIHGDVSLRLETAGTVTFNCIQLAIHMGFKAIYLVGVDHNFSCTIDNNGRRKYQNIKDHFNSNTAERTNNRTAGSYFVDFMTSGYRRCKEYADDNRIHIYNATKDSKLDVFERRDLHSVLHDKSNLPSHSDATNFIIERRFP